MKRILISITALVLCLCCLCSCGKYDKIEPTEDELRVIGSIRNYDIYYDELRCSVMNAKTLMAQSYGIDWNDPDDAAKYSEELSRRVFSGLKYNYAVQLLFADTGYTIDNTYIQEAVNNRMIELIDECGSRSAYIAYLRENFMTDRLLRFNIAIAYAVNELVYSLCDSGAFDEYGIDFDLEALSASDPQYPALYYPEDYQKALSFLIAETVILRSEHIYIPETLENAEALASDLFAQAEGGGSLTDLASGLSSKGVVREELTQVKGERNPDYYNAADKLEHNNLTLLHTEAGWYVIRRLELDMEYVLYYYFDLIYTYLSIVTNEHISKYEDTLELVLTDFGKSIDLIAVK